MHILSCTSREITPRKGYEVNLKQIEQEIAILKVISHPNIVTVHNLLEDKDFYFISMDYYYMGTVQDHILRRRQEFTLKLLRHG